MSASPEGQSSKSPEPSLSVGQWSAFWLTSWGRHPSLESCFLCAQISALETLGVVSITHPVSSLQRSARPHPQPGPLLQRLAMAPNDQAQVAHGCATHTVLKPHSDVQPPFFPV